MKTLKFICKYTLTATAFLLAVLLCSLVQTSPVQELEQEELSESIEIEFYHNQGERLRSEVPKIKALSFHQESFNEKTFAQQSFSHKKDDLHILYKRLKLHIG